MKLSVLPLPVFLMSRAIFEIYLLREISSEVLVFVPVLSLVPELIISIQCFFTMVIRSQVVSSEAFLLGTSEDVGLPLLFVSGGQGVVEVSITFLIGSLIVREYVRSSIGLLELISLG